MTDLGQLLEDEKQEAIKKAVDRVIKEKDAEMDAKITNLRAQKDAEIMDLKAQLEALKKAPKA